MIVKCLVHTTIETVIFGAQGTVPDVGLYPPAIIMEVIRQKELQSGVEPDVRVRPSADMHRETVPDQKGTHVDP